MRGNVLEFLEAEELENYPNLWKNEKSLEKEKDTSKREEEKMKKNQSGFTTVEIIMTTTIVGLIIAMGIPVYQSVSDSAKEQELRIKVYEKQLENVSGGGEIGCSSR